MTTDTITDPAGTQNIAEGRWRIDPARSTMELRTPTLWGLATVKGQFERYNGSLDLQRSPAIELTIEAARLITKSNFRDGRLRLAAFFDVENHPQVRFVSDAATLQGERLKVRGRLYAAGSSLPLELDASLRRAGDEFEIDARTYADQRKLGMLGMIPTPSELIVQGHLV